MKATALLTNWKRPENLPMIIESLRQQTAEIEIFLWDNSGSGEFDDLVDLSIRSSRNLKCFPRWSMSQFASGEFVFTLDDDLMITDRSLIRKSMDWLDESDGAIGKEGVTIVPGCGYFGGIHIRENSVAASTVDIIKGRFFFTRKETAVAALRGVMSSVSRPRIEDDIIISSGIHGNKWIPSFAAGAFRELPGNGEDEWMKREHKLSREQTFKKYFEHE